MQPSQSATDLLVDEDPENEPGKSNPPVPTYAASVLFPETSTSFPKLAVTPIAVIENARATAPAIVKTRLLRLLAI